MGKFSGVLVGINKYPTAPLRGCVNDVIIMRDILVQKYGVKAANVRLVLDQRATLANILERLEWLVANDAPYKFFHYSGHGAQVPNRTYLLEKNDTEIDGMDEILCPYDFDWNGSYVLDDQINEIISKLKPEHHMTMVFDCCHSGTIDRDVMNRPRRMEMPLDIRSRVDGEVLSRELIAFPQEGSIELDLEEAFRTLIDLEEKKLPAKPKSFSKSNVSIITGCMDNQTSSDAYLNGRFQGALSYMMQANLLREPRLTLKNLRRKCEADLKRNGFSQVPQMIGTPENIDKPFIQV